MDKIKVSAIIPNYNHEEFLKQRIESVLAQTYQDFEIILLDDASTDKSNKIINQYVQYPKVKHMVFNKKNSGAAFRQWENGMGLASGQYLWMAESDDWADPGFLAALVPVLEKNPEVGLVYC